MLITADLNKQETNLLYMKSVVSTHVKHLVTVYIFRKKDLDFRWPNYVANWFQNQNTWHQLTPRIQTLP